MTEDYDVEATDAYNQLENLVVQWMVEKKQKQIETIHSLLCIAVDMMRALHLNNAMRLSRLEQVLELPDTLARWECEDL